MVAVVADEALEPSWLSQILCGCCHREQALRRPQRTWSSQARITAERQWECKKTNLCEEHVSTVFPFLRGRLERMQDFPSICKSLCDCARRRAAESVKGRGLKRNKHQANEACTAHTHHKSRAVPASRQVPRQGLVTLCWASAEVQVAPVPLSGAEL